MLYEGRKSDSQEGDFVEFARAGMPAAGGYPPFQLRVRGDHSLAAAAVPDVFRDDLGADDLEPLHTGDEAAVRKRCLRADSDAEERLHLAPGGENHERSEEREHEQRHPEPDVGTPRGAAALDSGTAAGALAPVRHARSRVDRATARPRRGRVCGQARPWLDCSPGSIEGDGCRRRAPACREARPCGRRDRRRDRSAGCPRAAGRRRGGHDRCGPGDRARARRRR